MSGKMTTKMTLTAEQVARLHELQFQIEKAVMEVVSKHIKLDELRKKSEDTEAVGRITAAYRAVSTAQGFVEALMAMCGWDEARMVGIRRSGFQSGCLLAVECYPPAKEEGSQEDKVRQRLMKFVRSRCEENAIKVAEEVSR